MRQLVATFTVRFSDGRHRHQEANNSVDGEGYGDVAKGRLMWFNIYILTVEGLILHSGSRLRWSGGLCRRNRMSGFSLWQRGPVREFIASFDWEDVDVET